MKIKSAFICQNCGASSPKWTGRCPGCGEWNTVVQEEVRPRGPHRASGADAAPVRFDQLATEDLSRISTGIPEFDRVLGGGLVPGALVLVGGDPGVGKSTLMLAAAARLSASRPVLYASGEESPLQIRLRGERLAISPGQLHVYSELSIERILAAAEDLAAEIVIVDSIQTTFSERLDMAPGSIGQVREVASRFLSWTKQRQIPVFLIGHVTKDGSLAGPKALEHIVDTVLYFEGPRQHPHRIIRTIKNRFGAAHELGIFEMASDGLHPIEGASGFFLSGRMDSHAGSTVVCAVEGSRPLLVEIQALVGRTHLGTPRRLATGVDPQRLALIAAVIEKRLGIHLWDQDIYLNVVGGLDIDEPAADLGIAAAILSSFMNRALPPRTLVFGEIGLGGELRPCLHPALRLKEAATLGFERAVLPEQAVSEAPEGIERLAVPNLSGAAEVLFGLA